LFQDHFHISEVYKKIKEVSPNSKILTYFPIDVMTYTPTSIDFLDKVDENILYTEWSKRVLEPLTDKVKDSEVLYHGVNTEVFFPFSPEKIEAEKLKMGWQGKFIAVNVNRFQPRKQILASLRIWSKFVKGTNRCNSCNKHSLAHLPMCEYCSSSDITKIRSSAEPEALLYLHMQTAEQSMGMTESTNLLNACYQVGFTKEDINKFIAINQRPIYGDNGLPLSVVNLVYNLADLNLSTTCGEGAGLSLIESQACGIPSMAPAHSSIPEMLGDTGYIINNSATFSMGLDAGNSRPIIDEEEAVLTLKNIYQKWSKRKQKVINTRLVTRAKTLFNWDDKRKQLELVLDKYL